METLFTSFFCLADQQFINQEELHRKTLVNLDWLVEMVVVRPGDWVWLSADARASFQVPIGCQVKSVSKSNEVSVSDDEGRSYTFNLVKAASRIVMQRSECASFDACEMWFD